MIKRLEQVAALVVAAGLAIVSYWLFFSWAQGGGSERRQPQRHSLRAMPSEAAAGLDQPLPGGVVVLAGEMVADLLHRDGQPLGGADLNDAPQRPGRILEGLPEQGLGERAVGADALVELGGVACGHGGGGSRVEGWLI